MRCGGCLCDGINGLAIVPLHDERIIKRIEALHETGLNYYCSAYKAFLPHAAPKLAALLKMQGKTV